jgi:hypothetical protein
MAAYNFVGTYDINKLRNKSGWSGHFVGWSNPSVGPHPFLGKLHTDANGIKYSHGKMWHQNISDKPDGFLPNVYYKVNSEYRHWDEYVQSPDVVALGCSVTAGMGIPMEYTWPAIYRSVTGETVNNVGLPGASMAKMAYLLFDHISRHGLPKKIFILLGDPIRYWLQGFPQKEDLDRGAADYQLQERTVQWSHGIRSYVGYDGRPFTMKDSLNNTVSLSPDIAVSENMRAFEQILLLGKGAGIDVRIMFTSEHYAQQATTLGWPVVTYCEAKQPLLPTDDDQHLFWRFGFDFREGVHHHPHPGIESHIEWASAFIGRRVTVPEQQQITCWASHLFDQTVPKWDGPH